MTIQDSDFWKLYREFPDFWTQVDGRWLDKHAWYEEGQGCFPIPVSRSRRYAIIELGIAIPVAFAVAVLTLPEVLAVLA